MWSRRPPSSQLFEAYLQKMAFSTKASNLNGDELFVP